MWIKYPILNFPKISDRQRQRQTHTSKVTSIVFIIFKKIYIFCLLSSLTVLAGSAVEQSKLQTVLASLTSKTHVLALLQEAKALSQVTKHSVCLGHRSISAVFTECWVTGVGINRSGSRLEDRSVNDMSETVFSSLSWKLTSCVSVCVLRLVPLYPRLKMIPTL